MIHDRLMFPDHYIPLLDEEFDDADMEKDVNVPAPPASAFPDEAMVWFD